MAASRAFHARGWTPATSSNFSARLDARAFVVTASGLDKGELTEDGMLCVDLDGVPLFATGGRPSARRRCTASLYPALAGRGGRAARPRARRDHDLGGRGRGEGRLERWEVLKALEGVTTHEHVEIVPVVENDQDLPRLAARAAERLDAMAGAHAYLIAGHGLYTWGRTVADARRHVEALEHLFDCELRRMSARGGAR